MDIEQETQVNEQITVEEPETNTEQKTFTQAELDKIIADRLAREQKKRDEAVQKEREEAERKRLEEQEQYKELADQYRQELEAIKADALTSKKDALLAKAGYTDEQIAVLRNTVAGETDEELTKAIEELKAVITPKKSYIDPSPLGGGDGKPKPKDGEDIARDLYERIKHKLRK